jgi:predicted RNA-binding Zn-ribbon protein involved in translation (DUF1610 family)
MSEPIDECDACGEDLFDGVPHDCPVGGNIVIVRATDEAQKALHRGVIGGSDSK